MKDTSPVEIGEAVREQYAGAAREAAGGAFEQARRMEVTTGCGGGACGLWSGRTMPRSARFLYDPETSGDVSRTAVAASLGCGVPTAVADLHIGETVLDLGSGAGVDALISAGRVGPSAKAIGLEMTDERLELARANAEDADVDNIEFVKGYVEAIPLADASVDVVISNCVINLAADKGKVLAESARVLRPGGRFAVSDVIADRIWKRRIARRLQHRTGCVAGALTRAEYEASFTKAGLTEIEIREMHRVHEYAASAIIRARKPAQTEVA